VVQKWVSLKKTASMLFAVLGFAGPIIWLYAHNLQLESFCLMNINEPICDFFSKRSTLDCMNIVTNSNYFSAEESKFSGYIESGFGFQIENSKYEVTSNPIIFFVPFFVFFSIFLFFVFFFLTSLSILDLFRACIFAYENG